MNADGLESGLPDLCAVADLPVVQDDDEARVWSRWEADWRDVIVLGPDNVPVATYNLSEHSLAEPDNYAALKALLIEAAEAE